MDDKQMQRLLDEIAQQEVTDEMNLWPEIQTRLGTPTPQPIKGVTRLIRAGAALAIFLMVSAFVYAMYQQFWTLDGGLDNAAESNLLTMIGESQTVGNLTVTLDWAYADANRIAIGYTVSGLPDGISSGIGPNTALHDDEGRVFMTLSGGSNRFGVEDDPTGEVAVVNFDASPITETPQSLNLTLALDLQLIPMPPDGLALGGGGGGGGGGSSTEDVTPEAGTMSGGGGGLSVDVDSSAQPEYETVGPFNFEFSVPFIAAVVTEPMQAVEMADIAITLERVAVTPSLTVARLCYELPEGDSNWQPHAELMIGAEIVTPTMSSTGGEGGTGFLCSDIGFPAPYERQPTQWTLTVPLLEKWAVIDPNAIRDAMAAHGVEVEVSEDGFGYSVMGIPEGMEGAELDALLEQARLDQTETLEGPWVFEVAIP